MLGEINKTIEKIVKFTPNQNRVNSIPRPPAGSISLIKGMPRFLSMK